MEKRVGPFIAVEEIADLHAANLTCQESVAGCLAAAVQAAEEPILQLETGGHTAICHGVGFTPDGTRLVSAGNDKVVRVWDVTDPTQPRLERSLRYQSRWKLAADLEGVTVSSRVANTGRVQND